jgi:uncharacterized membrane protein
MHRRLAYRRSPLLPFAAAGPIAATAALLAITACGVEQVPDEQRPPELPRTAPAAVSEPTAADTVRAVSFTCDDMFRFTLVPDGQAATLFLPDTTLLLERSASSTGERYTRAGVELWHDSVEATLDLPDTTFTACAPRTGADPFTAARLRGATFRAVGQEPGWYLEISPDGMTFVGDYGERTLRTPAPTRTGDGNRLRWHATSTAGSLSVLAEQRPCSDGMSGEAFRWSVTVETAGTSYRGCGRRLD